MLIPRQGKRYAGMLIPNTLEGMLITDAKVLHLDRPRQYPIPRPSGITHIATDKCDSTRKRPFPQDARGQVITL